MKVITWLFRISPCIALLLAACSGVPKAPYIEPPDLLEQLANADLKPPPGGGPHARPPIPGGMTETELYPADKNVAAKVPAKTFQGVSANGGNYELNFSDAELSELAKVIFRDTLNTPYVFDQRVEGRVTVSTGGPVSRNELLSILEAVLEMNRATLISDGTLYRVVPESERRSHDVTIFDYHAEQSETGPGYGVTILPLKYVSSETMMRMLESLAPNPDGLRASVYNNLLMVRGTGAERETLLQTARTFDVDWMKGQSAGIFTLANSTPEDVIKELNEVFQIKDEGKGLIRFKPIGRMNAILALTQKSKLLLEVETWVNRLDRGGVEAEGYFVYRVENGRAKDLASLLNASFGSGGAGPSRAAEESEVTPAASASTLMSSDNGTGTGTGTGIGSGSGQQAGGVGSTGGAGSTFGVGQGLTASSSASTATSDSQSASNTTSDVSSDTMATGSLQGQGTSVKITADERNNSLLIKASAQTYRKILGVLRKIDRAPLQVLINATLAEVTLNDNLQYGVQFFLQNTKGLDKTLGFTNGNSIEIAPTAPGLNFVLGALGNNPRVILDALSRETAVRVVSSPAVVVLHNQVATLQVGDQVPITTRSATSLQPNEPVVVNEVEFRNTGVILKVTPRINSNGLVLMEIEQELSAVARTSSADSLTPTISQRRFTSTISVQSGQMVVLGGLISEQTAQDKSGIPIIEKIPYLGDVLGGQTGKLKARTELVVFLRPSVIRDPVDAANMTEAIRASMRSLAPRPAAWDMHVTPGPGEGAEFK